MHRKKAIAFILMISVAGSLGCTVGPDYTQPPVDLKETFHHFNEIEEFSEIIARPRDTTPSLPQEATGEQLDDSEQELRGWWQHFDDPTLDGLIDAALLNNSSLQAAVARLGEANALRRRSFSELLPTIVPGISYTERKASAAGMPGIPASALENAYFDAGVQMDWEIDIIGRLRRAYEAQDALSEASFFEVQAVYQNLVHEILVNYLEARGAHQEAILAQDILSGQREIVRLNELMEQTGTASQVEVLDAKRLQGQFEIDVANIIAIRDTRIATIAHLCRLPISEIELLLTSGREAPLLREKLEIGSPREVLQYRPDVAQAERRLAAATAQIGFEKADYWPRVSFTGLYGHQSLSFTELGDEESETFSLIPRISWAILDLGSIKARVQAASSRAQAALAEYEESVSRAITEVEQALITLKTSARNDISANSRNRNAERIWRIAQKEYEVGSLDNAALLAAKNQFFLSSRERTQIQVALAKSVVDLYRSMGTKLPYIPVERD